MNTEMNIQNTSQPSVYPSQMDMSAERLATLCNDDKTCAMMLKVILRYLWVCGWDEWHREFNINELESFARRSMLEMPDIQLDELTKPRTFRIPSSREARIFLEGFLARNPETETYRMRDEFISFLILAAENGDPS